ncbi:hypothetical protein [Phenylobacterium sp.]|nr:hypothetical protein [Phenylobacterium sp.]
MRKATGALAAAPLSCPARDRAEDQNFFFTPSSNTRPSGFPEV